MLSDRSNTVSTGAPMSVRHSNETAMATSCRTPIGLPRSGSSACLPPRTTRVGGHCSRSPRCSIRYPREVGWNRARVASLGIAAALSFSACHGGSSSATPSRTAAAVTTTTSAPSADSVIAETVQLYRAAGATAAEAACLAVHQPLRSASTSNTVVLRRGTGHYPCGSYTRLVTIALQSQAYLSRHPKAILDLVNSP